MMINILKEALREIDIALVRSSPCIDSIDDLREHKCIKYKYDSWSKKTHRFRYFEIYETLWSDWFYGPGRDFRMLVKNSSNDNYNIINLNEQNTKTVTRVWIKSILLAEAKKHFSSTSTNLDKPKFMLKQHSENEFLLRVVSPSVTLKTVLCDYVCSEI